VGNAGRSPMINSTGITGAAPIWHDFMEQAFQTLNLPDVSFTQPSSLLSGSQCRLADVNYFATSYMSDTENGTPIYTDPSDPYCTVPAVNGLDNPTTPGSNIQPTQPQQTQPQQQPTQQTQPQVQPTQAPIVPSNQQNQQQPSQQQPSQSQPSNNAPPPVLPGGTQ